MRKAFISVSDKTQLESVAQALMYYDIQLIASDGTAKFLNSKNIPVEAISDYLHVTSILDGRVKTLHPQLFGGILADRMKPQHLQDLEQLKASLIDFVIVDLYPFSTYQDIEHIDIGGIALIRAAAKNYQFCTVICEPADYSQLIDELTKQHGQTRQAFRKKMAARAFVKSSQYDAAISSWLLDTALLPSPASGRRAGDEGGFVIPQAPSPTSEREEQVVTEQQSFILKKSIPLAYGENPHQRANFYNLADEDPNIHLLQGKPLTYNNLLDLDAGIKLISEFDKIACAVIKHTNPCGVALGCSALDAVDRAFHADSKSAFGGIVVLNKTVDASVASYLKNHFIEVISAPSYTQEALDLFAAKPRCRIVTFARDKHVSTEIRSVLNGFLMQEVDKKSIELENIPTCRKLDPRLFADVRFAFSVVRHMKSNAIVVVKNGVTLSMGVGQTNRVDAVYQALDKLKEMDLTDAVLASDGFFPFADSIDLIAKTAIKTIIQPGGSLRDGGVIDACDRLGLVMIMTGVRSFRH